jgi:hypothetical protein
MQTHKYMMQTNMQYRILFKEKQKLENKKELLTDLEKDFLKEIYVKLQEMGDSIEFGD